MTPYRTLHADGRAHEYVDLVGRVGEARLRALPYSLRVLLENLLRHEDGDTVTTAEIDAVLAAADGEARPADIAFRPARVLMQDFTGIPGLVDLAALRDVFAARGGDPRQVNPGIPVDLIVDHSLIVDHAGAPDAMARNVANEYRRNAERYAFLRWAQGAFANLRVAPPGGGILHQVNLEHLARVVWTREEAGRTLAYPDTLVGTDSHTTMVNALGVLGWGVGGIEAEAAMLGQPLVFRLSEVVGVRLSGRLPAGTTATDLVLALTERLRALGVVEKFVEFTGPALEGALTLADRATIANMAPEYGSTCGFFPVDRVTMDYLAATGRDAAQLALVEACCKAQGLWRDPEAPEPRFATLVEFDLGTVEPCAAGPRRPQDRVALPAIPASLAAFSDRAAEHGWEDGFGDGAVVLAAITSCTNTSNPALMVGAGLLARRAVARGLTVPGWVKTSLTPGSRVVARYLESSGLQRDLDALGFHLTGFGCGSCGGNSGALAGEVAARIRDKGLVACAVLSGNRNFEGRIHPQARAGYLMSPPLVVAYALAGRVTRDLTREPLGRDREGRAVFLHELWPEAAEIEAVLREAVSPGTYRAEYATLFAADADWSALPGPAETRFAWDAGSTYIRRPPYFDALPAAEAAPRLAGARPLLILGDGITTDHISPVSAIPPHSPAGEFLAAHQVPPGEFNAYGARRANHEVMMRGAFANIRLRNEMLPGQEGGLTRHAPSGAVLSVHDAALRYREEGVPLVVVAGRDYGAGSSRDWAAKGPALLGVRAVIAESFERIHRSNLVSMGILPLEFTGGATRLSLGLDGTERFDIEALDEQAQPGALLRATLHRADGRTEILPLRCRLDSAYDRRVWRAGGILPFMLRALVARGVAA
ncbi:aconitate hydratase AcnA [Pseudoroseomonas rhizosphaerae]|uniref:Aconitate hydratase n=1 Tax=Teichococcus rhizosphaerae TaxID=1335062 RepID=A0A2C7AAQ6_9PROT|nr:aconitate hydratase AcnA [Pseudoroseomonas rhizosphaerae]PHK94166.1 aconitate hydratase AcnA [Pseudoroseomonas rhizosphaerae]